MEKLNLHFRKFGGLWNVSSGCKGYRILPEFGEFLSKRFSHNTLLVSLTDAPTETSVFECKLEKGQFGKYNHTIHFCDINSGELLSSEVQCPSVEDLGIDSKFYFNVDGER